MRVFGVVSDRGRVYLENHMLLRDKIGQLLILGFDGLSIDSHAWIVEQIEQYALGGVILFDTNLPRPGHLKNIESPAQVKRLLADLKAVNTHANLTRQRAPLPLICSVDCEGGRVNRLKPTFGFPELASVSDVVEQGEAFALKTAELMASTLHDVGFNVNFAPVLDVNVNPDNPILGKLGRCFSSQADVVCQYASIYVNALRAKAIEPVYKHFPGHGSSNQDSHLGFVDVTDSWQMTELDPYRQLLPQDALPPMIMTAHLVNRRLDESGLPATLSHQTLTGILRQELGFQGVIVTDDMQMKAIADHYGLEDSLCLALNAGADMFIFGNQLSKQQQSAKEIVDLIEKNVNSGKIAVERIDDAYARVVRFKNRLELP